MIQKLLAGDPGKRIPPSEMKAFERGEHPEQIRAKTKPIKAPKNLTKPAQAIWRELVGGHVEGTYAITDQHQMAAYCEAVATFQIATTMIESEGYIAVGSSGQSVVSPWVSIQKDARAAIDKLGPTLFLTPTAREAMKGTSQKPTIAQEFGGLIQ